MPLPVTVLPDTAIAASEILKFYDSVGNFLPRLYVFLNATGFRVFLCVLLEDKIGMSWVWMRKKKRKRRSG